MVEDKYVLIPWYPISYLTIAGYGFFWGGAYGSLPDAAIWWCLRTGGGGVLTRGHDMRRYNWYYVVVCGVCTMYGVFEKYCGKL